MSTTIAYEWRGGWLIVNQDTLEPGAVDDIGRIYGLNGLEQPVELTYLIGGPTSITQTIQQWESLGGQMLMPRADDDLTLTNFCSAQGIPYPTVFSALTPLPAIYGGGGSSDATALQGEPIAATVPTAGQALIYDGAQWEPTTLPAPSLALARFNGTDITQFSAPSLIGAPVNPSLAFVAPTATAYEGSILLGLDELTPDGAGAVWWLDTLVPVQPMVVSWFMGAIDPGDGFRAGLVIGGDAGDITYLGLCQQFDSVGPVSSIALVSGNGASPESTYLVSDPSTLGNFNELRVSLSAGNGDTGTFAPNGVPRFTGQFEVCAETLAKNARVALTSFLGPAPAGAEWGTRVNNRIGVMLQAVNAVPAGGIRISMGTMVWASNPNG